MLGHGDAQRRPEITPGYDSPGVFDGPQLEEVAQRRPEITPGYDACTDAPGTETRLVEERSTKAGDYPRLRPGCRVSPVSAMSGAQRRPEITPGYDRHLRSFRACRTSAQRRPEITPGYDGPVSPAMNDPVAAQRRPEITPGYDGVVQVGDPHLGARSTKAGDYPRLRRAGQPPRFAGFTAAQRRPEITPGYDAATGFETGGRDGSRSTKAGDYPRLRPGCPGSATWTASHAQRRPEITPGYDPGRRAPELPRYNALNEGRRLPPATT